tara:strand:- start:130 stop:366 length:237 start_codon:yes stop_codon:yes gene_type:complete
MNVTKKQAAVILTALHDYSSHAYINGKTDEMVESQNIIKEIEEEMQGGDDGQSDDVGSETGIERDYANQGKPDCEVCE